MKTKKRVFYFTDNGEYGYATGLIRVNTTDWSERDWQRIIDAPSSVRKKVAMQIEQEHENRRMIVEIEAEAL